LCNLLLTHSATVNSAQALYSEVYLFKVVIKMPVNDMRLAENLKIFNSRNTIYLKQRRVHSTVKCNTLTIVRTELRVILPIDFVIFT